MTIVKENGIGKTGLKFIFESLKTKQNPGLLLTLKENSVCFHVQLLMPKDTLGGLADTFLMLSRYLFKFVLMKKTQYLVL